MSGMYRTKAKPTYLYKVDEVGEEVLGIGGEPDLDLGRG